VSFCCPRALRSLTRYRSRLGYTKFRAFDFTEYDHILLLDSNTLIVSRDVYNIFDNDLDFAGVSLARFRVFCSDADKEDRLQNSISIDRSINR
jgi:alpha-N-acetylglucosamine transferase